MVFSLLTVTYKKKKKKPLHTITDFIKSWIIIHGLRIGDFSSF